MSFPKYPKYKDSGVEWLGVVPEHWDVWKLAHAFKVIGSGTTPKSDNAVYYEGGTIPWINTGDLNDGELQDCAKRITERAMTDNSSLKLYPADSLLIAMYGATIGKLAMLQFPATVNQACCVFGGSSPIVVKFMFYWFLGLRQQILSLATGGGQPNVSQDILRTIRVACAPVPEQTAIASFLDAETSKIDSLIAEQRRLIELLKEKRQAVISHAVTKGLNPNAPMKPSGIEWLGDVPEQWEIKRVSYLFRASKGRHGQLLTKEYLGENAGQYPVYSGQTESEGVMGYWSEFEYDFGDSGVLFSTTVGEKAMNISHLFGKFSLSQNCMVISSTDERCRTRFFYYHLQPLFADERAKIPEYMQASFRMDDLYSYRVALPPVSEQIMIAEFLNQQTCKFDLLITEATRAIDLLQERRTALISAAVSGKIDVREFASLEAA